MSAEPLPDGYSIRSIPTTYRGVEFKSKLEAHYAETFDGLDWPWKYEHHYLDTPHGTYVPDFAVSKFGYVEVKHENYIPTEFDTLRWEHVRETSGAILTVVYGEWSRINAARMGLSAYLADLDSEMTDRINREAARLRDAEYDDPFAPVSRRCMSCNRTQASCKSIDAIPTCTTCGEVMGVHIARRKPRSVTLTLPDIKLNLPTYETTQHAYSTQECPACHTSSIQAEYDSASLTYTCDRCGSEY